MCGIAGCLALDAEGGVAEATLWRMIGTLRHRGPDDVGVWTDGRAGLANSRLAVIDLSPRGHQPMGNEDASVHVVLNGEIYNFQALRVDLERAGRRFRSDSDTESILQLYETEGPDCLQRLRGMFAVALWDAPHRTLFVARDRLGKKPLFYYHDAHWFVFGSEPKAVLQHPAVRTEVDAEAIHHFLSYGFVPSPGSAFKGLRKLPPGHFLTVRDGRLSLHRYWTLSYSSKRRGREQDLVDETVEILQEAVRLRMISDVPIGALLSGGLDSATVVALMRRLTTGIVRTFSIGFDDPDYDELRFARKVADRFETEHHEHLVRPDTVTVLPRLVWHYNEPFADSSAIPSFAVSRLARREVTVGLNGDGGDESFLGYDRYLATALTQPVDRLPRTLLRLVASASRLPAARSPKSRAYRFRRLAEALEHPARRRYARWLTVFDNPGKDGLYTRDFAARVGPVDSLDLLERAYDASDAPTFAEATAHADIQLYLPDDLLVKMDIASMANSLEMRSPFLDHKVVEFAASLPRRLKLRRLTQKYIVRQAMRGVLPDVVLDRKKMGFGVPIDRWLRHDLREMAWDLLLDSRARQRGYFEPAAVRRLLAEHAEGASIHHARIWSLLMLELWHRMFIDQPCPIQAPETV